MTIGTKTSFLVNSDSAIVFCVLIGINLFFSSMSAVRYRVKDKNSHRHIKTRIIKIVFRIQKDPARIQKDTNISY